MTRRDQRLTALERLRVRALLFARALFARVLLVGVLLVRCLPFPSLTIVLLGAH
jgi:hypothetical protein